MCRQLGLCREQLREILVHPSGDAAMLPSTQWGQLAAIALCILPDLRQALADIPAQLRQAGFILQLLVHPDIPFVIRQPARPVPTIVGDIEWLIACWSLGQLRLCHRVGIIDATQLLILGMRR